MLNLKNTHRVSTSIRLAMEDAVHNNMITMLDKGKQIPKVAEQVVDSLARGMGSIRVPDISLDVTTKTWKQLKQIGAV